MRGLKFEYYRMNIVLLCQSNKYTAIPALGIFHFFSYRKKNFIVGRDMKIRGIVGLNKVKISETSKNQQNL